MNSYYILTKLDVSKNKVDIVDVLETSVLSVDKMHTTVSNMEEEDLQIKIINENRIECFEVSGYWSKVETLKFVFQINMFTEGAQDADQKN